MIRPQLLSRNSDQTSLSFVRMSILFGVSLCLSACWGAAPSVYYTLVSPSSTLSQPKPTQADFHSLGVGPITLPEHLDRPHLVTRKGKHTLQVHIRHRWGASLRDQILNQLEANLVSELSGISIVSYPWERPWRPSHQLMMEIKSLEGMMDLEVNAEFVWRIIDLKTEKVLHQGRYKAQSSARRKGQEPIETAYVRAMAETLSNFAKELSRLLQSQ